MGQQKGAWLGAEPGSQSPRLHKGVTKYDPSFDLASTLRLIKKSKAQKPMGLPSSALWKKQEGANPRAPWEAYQGERGQR